MNHALPLGWAYLPLAFALGALHALEPGHGKSLASSYLVSGEHTWKDALILGVATTFSHTAVVVLLAAGGLALKGVLPAGEMFRWVRLAGAGCLGVLGLWVAVRAVRDLRHGHSHGHSHGHAHGRAHRHGGAWEVALLGLGNGVLPCPGALAALLVALSLGRALLGLVTVLTYSLGLAAALATVGVLAVEAGSRARRFLPSDRAALWLPLASGLLVAATGAWLLAKG